MVVLEPRKVTSNTLPVTPNKQTPNLTVPVTPAPIVAPEQIPIVTPILQGLLNTLQSILGPIGL